VQQTGCFSREMGWTSKTVTIVEIWQWRAETKSRSHPVWARYQVLFQAVGQLLPILFPPLRIQLNCVIWNYRTGDPNEIRQRSCLVNHHPSKEENRAK
jgi:hypothetical protein